MSIIPLQYQLAAKIAAVAAVGVIGAAAWHYTPLIGPHARIGRLHDQVAAITKNRDLWRDYGHAEKRAYDVSEKLRTEETTQSRNAVNIEAASCDARVSEARRSSQAIRTLIQKEIARDPQGCPLRELVDPLSLRNALQPAPR